MATEAFHSPTTIDEAVALLAGTPGARPLAGGTDLVVQMRSRRLNPAAVVDTKRIEGLSGVTQQDGGFLIGAATPCSSLKDDEELRAAWPGVVEAANLIGSVQIRNRATMAGNLCNASPAADSVPALAAARAEARIAGPDGTRSVPVENVPTAPGRTSLADGEFVTGLFIPAQSRRAADAYLRSIPRTEMDIAVVGAGVWVALDADGSCREARIAIGAAAPTVRVVQDAGAALVGSRFEDADLARMEEAVRAACDPIDDKRGTIAYRKAMAAVLARRTLMIARERAEKRT